MGLRRTAGLATSILALVLLVPALASPPSVDAAAVALRNGNASNAVTLADQALADPTLSAHDRARVLLDRGLAHEALGEHDAAMIDFTGAINAHALLAAEQARAFYNRGVTLDELGRTEDAVGDYAAAIALEPQFAAALNNRGNAYRRLGRLQAARSDYLASIAAGNPHPEYPDYGLGQVAEAAGNPDAARAFYRAALAASPQFALAQERLAALGPGSSAPAPIRLRPPPQAAPVQLKRPPSDDAPIQLKPPGEAEVHLKPPTAHRPAAQPPGLDLKPAIADAAPAPAGGPSIQLGAWRSQGEAANAWSRIARASGTILAGMTPQVIAVDLPGKGRYYRLRAQPDGSQTAAGVCAALVARGQACIVVKD